MKNTLSRLPAAFSALLLFLILTPANLMAREVTILQDINGIKHVYAESNADLFYGFGYAMAQDRLFQMEMRKRQALGRTAEVLGKGDRRWPDKYLSKDIDSRILVDMREVRRGFHALPEQERQLVTAFTDGVNQAITEILKDQDRLLTKPFRDFGFLPEKWTPIEAMAMAVDVLGAYSSFTTQMLNMELYEFLRANYPENCDDIFDQLLWTTDVNAPTTLRDHQAGGADPAAQGPRGCARDGNLPNGLAMPKQKLSGLKSPARQQAPEPRRASMGWMVGSDMAEGFRSIFVSGPQPGWHSPGFYYPIGLHGGDFDLMGFAAEGSFILQVGASRHLSWGLTAGLGHQVDHFQEELRAPGSLEYRHDDGWKTMEERQEAINIKGEKTHIETILQSVHGPVIAHSKDKRFAYSQRIAWRGQAVRSVMNWVNSTRAKSHNAWLEHVRGIAFGYNLFYADRQGRVGFFYTGAYADLKPGHDRRLPAAGHGAYDWKGLLPADANPWMLTSDYLVNFNNKPSRDWPNSGIFWEQWGAANQTNILLDAFRGKDSFTWEEMWNINRVVSLTDVSASYFIPFIVDATKDLPDDSPVREAARLIAEWNRMRTDDDGAGLVDHAGQTLFDAWLPVMVRKIVGPVLDGAPPAVNGAWTAAGYQTGAPRLEEHPSAGTQITYHALLNASGKSGVRHHYDLFRGKKPEQVIVAALIETVGNLATRHDGPMKEWKAKAVGQVFFDSNANRIPMTSPGTAFTLPVYANRGAVNLQVGYEKDGDVFVAYVAPPGPGGFIPLDGKPGDNPRLASHLQRYNEFRLFGFSFDRKDVSATMTAPPVRLMVPDIYGSRL